MDVLRSQGVFFDPPSEIHYYEALGHMATADALGPSTARRSALQAAALSWQHYLALSEEDDPWRDLAERHAVEVRSMLGR